MFRYESDHMKFKSSLIEYSTFLALVMKENITCMHSYGHNVLDIVRCDFRHGIINKTSWEGTLELWTSWIVVYRRKTTVTSSKIFKRRGQFCEKASLISVKAELSTKNPKQPNQALSPNKMSARSLGHSYIDHNILNLSNGMNSTQRLN